MKDNDRLWSLLKYVASRTMNQDGCIVWTGYRDPAGYGRLRRPSLTKQRLAHRATWEAAYGNVPAELDLCHTCDNPSCVLPAHLFLGTARDNARDMIAKGRKASTAGESHPRAILSDVMVRDIRARLARGDRGVDIARNLGITKHTVSDIKRGKSWSHIQEIV